jgi:cytoskeletal protein CcmA (bactofilin family)
MSFRKYGGTQFSSSHNIVKSNVNTTDSFYVTKNVGQPNTYINFESDISGNMNIYGNLDVSGNLSVSGDVDINGKLHVQEYIDCSGNVNIDGDVDINGKLHVQQDIDCSGNVNISSGLGVSGLITANTLTASGLITATTAGITTLQPSNGDSSSKVPTTAWVNNAIVTSPTATQWTTSGLNIYYTGGYVGIGSAPVSYNFQVFGTVGASSFEGANFYSTSDYRIKTDVVTLDDKFTVDKLRPVTYNNTKLDKQDIGLIAHELQEVYPFLVTGEKDGENLQSVNYTGLISILIKEIQDLKERVKKLENPSS